MALLDLQQIPSPTAFPANIPANARLYVLSADSETLSPLFQDSHLTEMQANPVIADASGTFPALYVQNGEYRLILRSAQGRVLHQDVAISVRGPAREFATPNALRLDNALAYNGSTQTVAAGNVLRVIHGGFSYTVADENALAADIVTTGGVNLALTGRDQFCPEAFGAAGDGVSNDTAAWNAMLRAVARATAQGPAHIHARGRYLLDQLDGLSQFSGPDVQEDSVTFDLSGAYLIHSGNGAGILPLEGRSSSRARYEINGGVWQAHADTNWLIRGRDVRGSLFAPEALIGPSGCFGILLQNWRTWSENNGFGGARTLEGRKLGHILGFQGRLQAWAAALTEQGAPADADNYLGALSDDPAGQFGAFYYNTSVKKLRHNDGTAWLDQLVIDDVDASVSGKSFARTKIANLLSAGAFDEAKDGLAIHVDGASLYDSEIDGLRGNVGNDGGSLIWWNDNYARGTVIRNVGVEKANVGSAAHSVVFRTGPLFLTATAAPYLENISWTGGFAQATDPDAGVAVSTPFSEAFIDTQAGIPATVLSAGQLHGNSMVELALKTDSNLVMGRALVARKNASPAIRIEDCLAQRMTAGPWSRSDTASAMPVTALEGPRWLAPRSGSITGIVVLADQAALAGNCTVAARHNPGSAGSSGTSVGVSAALTTGETRSITRRPAGETRFAAGDEIYAVVTTDAAWTPENVTLRVAIEVQLDGDVIWGEENGALTIVTQADETLRVVSRVWKS
ncbi:hypothetical protein E4Z66_16610 [Aliishimia ponticola]|uniref:Pectate lyase superfamily protein domain-containing protein n=1 Tax=Aliishimia ponticola TaxID=2499833 RepID=A0A4S4NBQ0_9RHOB|nr:hypothetical protein [Aliishimia ponticola]THH35431.1 hypothetical protein E4Z66_16610 [Aliishimia ponticola]